MQTKHKLCCIQIQNLNHRICLQPALIKLHRLSLYLMTGDIFIDETLSFTPHVQQLDKKGGN